MAFHIRDGDQVWVVRTLPHVSRGKAGKPGSFADHFFQRGGRNELGLGDAAHFDERAEEVFDAFLLDECLEILSTLCLRG